MTGRKRREGERAGRRGEGSEGELRSECQIASQHGVFVKGDDKKVRLTDLP